MGDWGTGGLGDLGDWGTGSYELGAEMLTHQCLLRESLWDSDIRFANGESLQALAQCAPLEAETLPYR